MASVCENFTSKDISYVPIGHVLEEYSISCLVDKVKKLGFVKDFKHMILFDALILNEDRHFGNFWITKKIMQQINLQGLRLYLTMVFHYSLI